MKKMLAAALCFLLAVSICACGGAPAQISATNAPSAAGTHAGDTAAPTQAVPGDTQSPVLTGGGDEGGGYIAPEYGVQGQGEAGLTDEQFEKIDVLVAGVLSSGYFSKPSELRDKGIFIFVHRFLNNYPELVLGDDWYYDVGDNGYYIQADVVEKLLRSAFGIEYRPSYAGSREIGLTYKDGAYGLEFPGEDPQPWPEYYEVSRLASGQILLKFDIVNVGGPDDIFQFHAKAQAVLQEDGGSLFGYRMVSFTEIKSSPKFTQAGASANASDAGKCIDGKPGTVWAADMEDELWLEISAGSEQSITGLSFYVGDRTQGDEEFVSGYLEVSMEFSDGTTYEGGVESVYGTKGFYSLTFDREVKTKYVKIMILSSDYDTVEIAEIKPF
jgi:hypothetical protein